MAIPVALITELLIPVGKKLLSKPKTLAKEATLTVLFTTGLTIYDQYAIGGIEAIDKALIATFISGLWVLGVRLYTKHKEDKAPNVLS